jgi:hypothetical protein
MFLVTAAARKMSYFGFRENRSAIFNLFPASVE